jgi:alpha-L-rhamnosidase
MEMPGWDRPGFDDRAWERVAVNAERGSETLSPKPFAPVRATETLAVQHLTEPEPGRFIFDLGQNMVGWAKLDIRVEEGRTVTVRFAEMLNPDGTMYTDNYRSAKSADTYTAAKSGRIVWEPTFTFHGFRYVELSGLPKGARPEKGLVEGVVLHSDLPQTGTFESSHGKLNQLQSNIVWGQRGNFLDIPTDCPQRDERLGWTGDAQVFCPTSMFNYDCHAFWKSWLGSVRDDQFEDGRIPHVVPDVLKAGDSPGWMDAATFIPWEVYLLTGDVEILSENFEMMERLVGFYRSQSKQGLILAKERKGLSGFGDWLQPYAEDQKGDTPLALLTTAYYARSAQILADSARVLNKTAEAKKYAAEAESIRQAFAKYYFNDDGKLKNAPESQTGYLISFAFDLVPAELQDQAAERLVRQVHEADDHLRTGFLGTPYIAAVLDRTGHSDLAYEVLFKETYPSWFYSINQGATTMWERWNSYSHTDGFGDVNMNSFNHYAYGAINQWMVERIAGLAPDPANPGYKHFFVRPVVGPQLDWARAEYETPYGKASSGWKREGGKIVMDAVVPPNTTATIEFPNGRKSETVSAGNHHFELEM